MSVRPVPVSQLIQNLRGVLQQIDSQTSEGTPLGDSTNKQTSVSWIFTAERTRKAAEKLTPELQKLEQFELALKYRTSLLGNEPRVDSNPLVQRFTTLAEKFGIPADFVGNQLHHLCFKYPSFAQMLLEPHHEELADSFFKFCLQSPSQSSHRGRTVTHWVDIYVKYPEIAERLMESSFYVKLGMFPENISVDSRGVYIKIEGFKEEKKVAGHIPLNFKKESLDLKWSFANAALEEPSLGIILTVEQVFKQFEGSSPSDIDVSMRGIINLNSTLLVTRTNEKDFPVDPNDWTKHSPHVELSWLELKAKYPEAKEDLNFGFVLIAEKGGQTFFDFIMKADNGNYRIFSLRRHQKAGADLDQQRRTFSCLTDEQGALVIRKVAEDIEHCRKAEAEGRPIPPLDVQSYVDEVLGHPFYDNIEKLTASTDVVNELTQARQNLDTAAFEKVLKPIIDRLIAKRDMRLIHQFIKTSLEAIYSVLQKDGTKNYIPTDREVEAAGSALFERTKSIDQMGPSLVALGCLCFEVLHPYRMTVADAERDTPVLGRIFRIVEAIPWIWLKNLLSNFLLIILGPFRGYHYKTLVAGNKGRLKKISQAIGKLKPEKYINRPTQLFESLSTEQRQAIADRIKNQLTVLAVRGASAGVVQPQPPPAPIQPTHEVENDLFFSVVGDPPKDAH